MIFKNKALKKCIAANFYFNFSKTYSTNTKNKYSSTVHLPHTKFPLRLSASKRVENDNFIHLRCKFDELYSWQRKHLPAPDFILHDGPPYANGSLHMGHAINKILKDIICRHHVLKGQRVHYVPGWDCHGLPIELKALSESDNVVNTTLETRKKAKKFATEAIKHQRKTFKQWGIMADWDSDFYTTYSSNYIINQMKLFGQLYEKGLVYRDVKPVYWSPSSRTALAEAELVYNEQHKSISVYLALKLASLSSQLASLLNNVNSELFALIWTTTPWSLPANQAVCFNEKLSYSIININDDNNFYLIATDCLQNFTDIINKKVNIISSVDAKILHNVTYHHPLQSDEILPFLPSNHVSSTKGTGLVHIAPAHGPDDFLIAKSRNMSIKCLVDENGCYTKDAGDKLRNLPVLTKGNEAILELISKRIVHRHNYIHSYPYDWRTNKPVILKASQQWFIDTDALKNKAIKQLDNVRVLPENSNINIRALIEMINSRPYWCISRQRVWGAPIPVIYEKNSGKPIVSCILLEHFSNLVAKHGPDYWWTLSLSEILPQSLNLDINNIQKGEDIFDIWFDSGISWSSVLGNEKTADLYLEGMDQLTGWFQSSLLTSTALRDCSPFKNLYVHGFAVDEKGRKMSKSLGNVTDPNKIISGEMGKSSGGIDVLRWWVASHSMSDSKITVGPNVLETSADEINKIRNVMRFLLGALKDFHIGEHDVEKLDFNIIDGYLLHMLWNYNLQVTDMYDNYKFNMLCRFIINFITNTISGFYCHLIKNRLYCEHVDSSKRRAAQFVIYQILMVLNRSFAPIVPHLAEEIQMHNLCDNDKECIFFTKGSTVDNRWNQPETEPLIELVLDIKKDLYKKIAEANSNSFSIKINASANAYNLLKLFQATEYSSNSQLVEILQVSEVQLIRDSSLGHIQEFKTAIEKSKLSLCERCRRFSSEQSGELCNTCTLQINI